MDESGGEIKGDSVRVINNVVDRVRLVPELAGIIRICPLICFISCSHGDAGLCLGEVLNCG